MTPTAASSRQFHLLVVGAVPGPSDGRPAHVVVPDGVSRLVTAYSGTALRCESASAERAPKHGECLLEPVVQGGVPWLMLLAPDRRPVLVNGERRTRIAGLRERDQVQLRDGRTLQVALHLACVIGRAPDSHKDQPCAVCHEAVDQRVVYLCASCDCIVHCDRRDPDDVRDCLSLCSECPSCRAPIVHGGYSRDPET